MLRKAAALALAAGACGCAVHPYSTVSDFAAHTDANSFELFDGELTPAEALVLPVVHDRQLQGPSCGAHALASIVNYWRGGQSLTGEALFREKPPALPAGYSLAELASLAQTHGLLASPVRLNQAAVVAELEHGRPVLIPVRLPSVYVQNRALPGARTPVIGKVGDAVMNRAGRVSELGGVGLVDHYLVVVGYQQDLFVVVEPIRGYRTIRAEKLARYRARFNDAAIVFSTGLAAGA